MPKSNETDCKQVKSVDEYVEHVKDLVEDSRRIFRGQADASWSLESAALRRIKKSMTAPDSRVTQQQFIEYHRDLIDRIRSKGHGDKGSLPLHDLELLAKLQHYGAATAFIDFTRNIYVALWFAVDSQSGKDGKVFILNNTDINKFKSVNEDEFNNEHQKKIEYFLSIPIPDPSELEGQSQLSYWYWEAQRVRAERIIRQSSIFVFRKPKIDEGDYQEIVIAESKKNDIRMELERLHDINAETLFPDFPGLATANNTSGHYHIKLPQEYYTDGYECFQKGEYDLAISSLTKVIKLDPQYPMAYHNRAVSYIRIGRYEKAIEDYSEAIKISPEFDTAYSGRGFSYAQLSEHKKAIEDYTQAIKLNPQNNIAHYYNRNLSYIAVGQYEKAIEDCNKAIKISPQYAEAYLSRAITKFAINNEDTLAKDDLIVALGLAREQNKEELIQSILEKMNERGIAHPE